MSYKEQVIELEVKIINSIISSLENIKHTTKSNFNEGYYVLDLETDNEELCFNLYTGYIVEICKGGVINNYGNIYLFNVLSLEQLAKIADFYENK